MQLAGIGIWRTATPQWLQAHGVVLVSASCATQMEAFLLSSFTHIHGLPPGISFLRCQTCLTHKLRLSHPLQSHIVCWMFCILDSRQIRSHQTCSCTTDSTPQASSSGFWHQHLYADNYKIHIARGNNASSSPWECDLRGWNETMAEIRRSLIAAYVCFPLLSWFFFLTFG